MNHLYYVLLHRELTGRALLFLIPSVVDVPPTIVIAILHIPSNSAPRAHTRRTQTDCFATPARVATSVLEVLPLLRPH